jgi:hypothetical protein
MRVYTVTSEWRAADAANLLERSEPEKATLSNFSS